MNLQNLKRLFSDNGCEKIYVKVLAPNDNSKNQVYLGGNFEVINILPISDIVTEEAGDWKKERFKAKISFYWLSEDGSLNFAPNSQLILYPKYPEVRFSGFLAHAKNAPSKLMSSRDKGRILFLGIKNREIIGYVCGHESEISKEYNSLTSNNKAGVFSVLELSKSGNNRIKLLEELLRIHQQGWINSKRLDRNGNILPCKSSNCGGYTLEAELGITPNGYSEPDYLGWEIKQFGVTNFNKIDSKVITLMTPEPTNGLYKEQGAESFIRHYGYPDMLGRKDRMNFGGIHKFESVHPRTQLRLELIGFDKEEGKIRNADGRIALIDKYQKEAASWSFSSLLLHWNKKHNQACYIPSMSNKTSDIGKYLYGNNIILGSSTDFQLFLNEMAAGHIYYDPGIKLENISTKPIVKKRSQFRILARNLVNLYKRNEIINLLDL